MTEHSQNGWPASPSLLTRAIVVDGATFRIADDRDVETVFVYILTQYAANVETLIPDQCGGYNYRPNRNDPSKLSNHSSATAVDANSLKHPNGVPRSATFTPAQVRACHAILASVPELDEVVHWGGDWFPPLVPDGMHWELHDHDLAKLARVADRIRAMGDDMPLTDEDAAKIAKALLDNETVTLRKADGTEREIPVRNALERILNPDDQ